MPNFILPSLSRAPSFKTQRKLGQGGTLSDPMESGYVSTRPRFTRQRRVFSVAYDLLTAEDVRALDRFEVDVVQGGAGAFYLPNLLCNGSFELPGDTDGGIGGWTLTPGTGWAIATSPNASDGVTAIAFALQPGAPVGSQAQLANCAACSVTAGDIHQVNAQVNFGTLSSVGLTLAASIALEYADGSTAAAVGMLQSASTVGYQLASATMTIPVSPIGATAATAQLSFLLTTTSTGAALPVVYLDETGWAQSGAAQPFGRMPGSASPASAVRITSKDGFGFTDGKWAGGQKVYGANFEVTEL